jgi:GNAT superfamily N-acetyltransferase
MNTSALQIRPAARTDVSAIVRLIRALAEFERLDGPDDEAALRLEEHAFGPSPRCEILVADQSGIVAGYALYFMTYSTFLARPSLYLEDLFVDPAHRRRGVGTAFLRRLASIAVERGCGRFEWAVLDWNVNAQRFYESLGARVMGEWRVCRLDGDALAALGRRDRAMG